MRSPVPRAKNASVGRVASATGRASSGASSCPYRSMPLPAVGVAKACRSCSARKQRAGLEEAGLQLGVAADAVLDDVDEFGGAPLVLGVEALVAGLADVGEDGVLVPVPVGDVVERLVDQVGHGLHPVDRADVAPGCLQGAAQGLGVLDGAVAGLLGGELGVGEPAAADQHLQLHLGGDLGGGDVGVERTDQDVDRLVGGAQVDAAVGARHLLDELEVVVAPGVRAVRPEGAVDGAEAAVDAADVDQRLEHPAGDPDVLGGGPLGVLRGDPGLQAAEHYVPVGPGVEVHVEGDQVDRGQADLGHGVRAVLAGQVDLAAVQVVQRRGAGQRLEPAGEALVRGRAGRGPGGLICDGGHRTRLGLRTDRSEKSDTSLHSPAHPDVERVQNCV